MDDRKTRQSPLEDGHLTDAALEAWVGDREDLLGAEALAHLPGCAACSARLAAARLEAEAIEAALHQASELAFSDAELSAMVRQAVATSLPEAARPPSRSLAMAAALGIAAALTLGVLSLESAPSVGGVISTASRAWTIASASDRLITALIPGGWAALALGLSALLLMLAAPLRALLSGTPGRWAGAAMSVALVSAMFVPQARALDFEGEWPVTEELTVVAEGVPASVALERAAEAAGLGFVGALSADPVTHLRVRDASLRDVVTAVLGADAPLVVERTPTLLIVRSRPVAAAPPITGAPVAPTVPAAPATPATPAMPATPAVPVAPAAPATPVNLGSSRERVSFGGDVVVRRGEVVDSVATMGGNAIIEGEVLGEVVAMGGNVHVLPGGIVHGEIAALGGEVQVDEGAHTSGEVMEGWGSAGVERPEPEPDAANALASWVGDTLASGARHALLFLFGLLLLGLMPGRLELVSRTITGAPARAGLAGGLSAFASLVLAIVLVITIVGIPGAVLLALAAAVAVYAGLVAIATVIGRALPIAALKDNAVLQLGAGVMALFVAAQVPWLGTLVVFVAGLVGLGAVVLTRAGTRAESAGALPQEALAAQDGTD